MTASVEGHDWDDPGQRIPPDQFGPIKSRLRARGYSCAGDMARAIAARRSIENHESEIDGFLELLWESLRSGMFTAKVRHVIVVGPTLTEERMPLQEFVDWISMANLAPAARSPLRHRVFEQSFFSNAFWSVFLDAHSLGPLPKPFAERPRKIETVPPPKPRRGHADVRTSATVKRILADLESGLFARDDFFRNQKQFADRYDVSRDTFVKARKRAFSGVGNSADETPTNDT